MVSGCCISCGFWYLDAVYPVGFGTWISCGFWYLYILWVLVPGYPVGFGIWISCRFWYLDILWVLVPGYSVGFGIRISCGFWYLDILWVLVPGYPLSISIWIVVPNNTVLYDCRKKHFVFYNKYYYMYFKTLLLSQVLENRIHSKYNKILPFRTINTVLAYGYLDIVQYIYISEIW